MYEYLKSVREINMRPNIIQFFSNTAIMMSAIFIPNFALEIGASRAEIGLIGASYGFALFFSSYMFGRASDMRDRRIFLTAGLLLSALAFFLQVATRDALSLMLIRGLAGFSLGIFTAPLIAYTFESGVKPGMFSSYGALGWAFGGLLAGIIAQHGEMYVHVNKLLPYWEVFVLSSMLFLFSFYISLKLPEVKMKTVQVSLFPAELIKRNIYVYLPSFLRHLGAFSIWIIFPLFLAELGASKFWIGVMYTINAGTQFLVMRRVDIAKDTKLVNAGLLLSLLVFFSYTFSKNFYHVMPIQIFLAVSYSCLYVGSLIFLTNRNEEKATCVGILNSITSISTIFGSLLGGIISQVYGFHATMYLAALLSAAGLLISIVKR